MKRRPLPLDTDDWLSSVEVLAAGPAARGAYIDLLCAAWNAKDGCLPSDTLSLERLSRMPPQEWAKAKPVVLKFFIVDAAGRLFHPKLLALWHKAHGGKVAAKRTAKDDGKQPHGENGLVMLLPKEWADMVASLGERDALIAVQVLDDYFAANNKRAGKYTSHRACFRTWVLDSEKYRKEVAKADEREVAAHAAKHGKKERRCGKCGGALGVVRNLITEKNEPRCVKCGAQEE